MPNKDNMMTILSDGVKFSGHNRVKGFIRIVDRTWISLVDVLHVAIDLPQAKVDEMAIEGILNLRYDIDEDGSPYMDV